MRWHEIFDTTFEGELSIDEGLLDTFRKKRPLSASAIRKRLADIQDEKDRIYKTRPTETSTLLSSLAAEQHALTQQLRLAI